MQKRCRCPRFIIIVCLSLSQSLDAPQCHAIISAPQRDLKFELIWYPITTQKLFDSHAQICDSIFVECNFDESKICIRQTSNRCWTGSCGLSNLFVEHHCENFVKPRLRQPFSQGGGFISFLCVVGGWGTWDPCRISASRVRQECNHEREGDDPMESLGNSYSI